jgi:hypothetical protein
VPGSPASGDAAAIRAAIVRDITIAVAPWILCSRGKAVVLSIAVLRARQAQVDAVIDRTYAANEPTHAAIRARLNALIAAFGVGGGATRAGETLCDVSGGIDRVRVCSLTIAKGRARITMQAHEWNETIGWHHGVAFHFRPEAVILQTDAAILQQGRWLIAQRGSVTFLNGAP